MNVASMQEHEIVRCNLFRNPSIGKLYETYLVSRESVPDEWRTYFDALQNVPHVDAPENGGLVPLLVLPVSIPKHADPAAVSSMVEALEKAIIVLAGTGQAFVLEQADRLAELATGMLQPSVELVEDRVRRMKTVQQVFAEGDWLTAEQINALQVEPPANKSHPASDWKRRGRIFSVNYGGKEYFARHQLDALYQPLPIVKDILKQFGEVADPWVLAAWFHFPNGWIAKPGTGGKESLAPKDALNQRDVVLNAAAQRQASYVA